jgi:hypothetical protein
MKLLQKKLHPSAILFILLPFLATIALILTTLQKTATTDVRSKAATAGSCQMLGQECGAYTCCSGLSCYYGKCSSYPMLRPSATPGATPVSCPSGSARGCVGQPVNSKITLDNVCYQCVRTWNSTCSRIYCK